MIDEGWMDNEYKTWDTSYIVLRNFVFFYKRDQNSFKLQQYDLIKNEIYELDGYTIKEPAAAENIHFQIIFSKNLEDFDQDKKLLISVENFLKE